jgi:long-chain acyl-CoA synthetase
MYTLRNSALVLLLALLAAAPAMSAVVSGVRLDDRISVAGRSLVLNGAGARTKVLVQIYVVSLYLTERAKDVSAVFAKAPRRIQLNMLQSAPSEEIVKAILDTMADNNTPAEMAAVKRETNQLVSIIRPFKQVGKNDVITLDFVDGGTLLGWKGRSRGRIPGEAFNRALTKIWLGDQPVQADLKQALLGG